MRGYLRVVGMVAALALVAIGCTSSPTSDSGGGGGDGGGGGEGSGEKVTIDFWVTETGGGAFLAELETDFEAKYPNIDLNVTGYPEDNYDVKLDTAIAAGKAPDLVVAGGDLDHMRKGLLLPLDDMVQQDNIDLSTYVPAIVEPGDEFSCNYEGHLYCLGSYIGSVQMLYNKDMFDAAGIAYPAAVAPDDARRVRRHRVSPHRQGERCLGWRGLRSARLRPLRHAVQRRRQDRRGVRERAGLRPPVPDLWRTGTSRAACRPRTSWTPGSRVGTTSRTASSRMVITDFLDLKKVENAGINYGTTAVPDARGRRSVLLHLVGQRRRDGELGAPRRGDGFHRVPDD